MRGEMQLIKVEKCNLSKSVEIKLKYGKGNGAYKSGERQLK
jgi:hypothetical protein